MQQRAQRAGLVGRAHRVFHLAQDLRLAQHHGIQAAGHAERMAHGIVVLVAVQVRAQGRGFQPVVLSQPGRQMLGHLPSAAQ